MIREEIILKYSAGKDVLDIGSTGQTEAYFLYTQIQKVARSLTGIDIVPTDKPGIVLGDMETYDFGRQFDMIIAGDVLEHVYNQGLFLGNIRKHLRDGGVFILTTPNAKWPTVFLRPNSTHTLWHDHYTLEYILMRHGFRIEIFKYYYGNKPSYNFLEKFLVLRQGMLAVCRKSD